MTVGISEVEEVLCKTSRLDKRGKNHKRRQIKIDVSVKDECGSNRLGVCL